MAGTIDEDAAATARWHAEIAAHYAIYLELLDIGHDVAMSHPSPEERRYALERLRRGWAGENRDRDQMWARIARAGS